MKTIQFIAPCALALVLSGCVTTSKVQEMIDASKQDHTTRVESNEASIDVLKQSAVAGLEKSMENAELIKEMQVEIATLREQVLINKGFAEAAKLMSAANTVKVDELDVSLKTNTEADAETKRLLIEVDKLYEGVMISHYQMIADSAAAAVDSLKTDGWVGSTNEPINLDEPIEILAPETTPTNAVEEPAE